MEPAPPGRLGGGEGAARRKRARGAAQGEWRKPWRRPRRARRAALAASHAAAGSGASARSSARASSRGRSQRWRPSGGSSLADAPCGGCGCGAAHGVDAAERLIQHERERVEVGAGPNLVAVDLLGGHVGECAEHVPGARQRLLAGEQRAAEVGELRDGRRSRSALDAARAAGIGGRNQHVLRLDVAVDHPARVGVHERVGERDPDFEHLLVAERLGCDQLREGVAVHQLGDQVEGVVLGAGLVQGDDRGMREAGGGERLARARARDLRRRGAGSS